MKTKSKQTDERLESVDWNLWEALAAIDRKDYDYWDKLTPEQQRKFVPYMMIQWAATVGSNSGTAAYYVRSVDYHANQHMFNEVVQNHPKLQWLMLCAASPGLGKQKHTWLPHLSSKITLLKEEAKVSDVADYLGKVHTGVDGETLKSSAREYVTTQRRGVYLAKHCPQLKLDDVATLNAITSDSEIEEHRSEHQN